MLLTKSQLALAADLAAINFANPFLPERIALERRILGSAYVEVGEAKSLRPGVEGSNPNSASLLRKAEELLETARANLADGASTNTRELELFEALALFILFHRWMGELGQLVASIGDAGPGGLRVRWWQEFRDAAVELLRPAGRRLPHDLDPEHLVGLYFQIARAFDQIYAHILGTSKAAIRLRAEVWNSIFTHDLKRYQHSVYRRMADLSTLVTGPSGTGKELVASAIGHSAYIPFDPEARAFAVDFSELFLPLNLTALSPTLIESELFGHRRGAFTGALGDRTGWFEACDPHGAVFLDEIGEIAPEIQVKLLRVLQTRRFQRLGDTKDRSFHGKLISATNRDLGAEMDAGRFREDLYYRICSDQVVTPGLAEQVEGSRDELEVLVLFVAQGLVGEEGPTLTAEVLAWVESELGLDYAWPGNFRELEQCVRNVLIRREYRGRAIAPKSVRERLSRDFLACDCDADEILRRYCTLVYARVKSYEGAARALGLDRRTVKAKVDRELLRELDA